MAEHMTELQVKFQEKGIQNCLTRNEDFDKNDIVIKDLWDPEELYSPVPEQRGQFGYWDKNWKTSPMFPLSNR